MQTSTHFTAREKEVINWLLQGKSNKQIALALGITKSTVEYHLKNIYKKLDVNSRAETILKLSKDSLLESTGDQRKEALLQSIGDKFSQAEYSSQAKQFFDPKEEKAMKNRTLISVFLSAIALIVAVGAVAYLKLKTTKSEPHETTSEAATAINTPRGVLHVPPESSTRAFDEALLLLRHPQPPFHYAAVFAATGCFIMGENQCGFTDPIPFAEGESMSGASVYWMPDGENGFYFQGDKILVLNHLERKSALSSVLVSNILGTEGQIHISPDGRWLVESVEVNEPYASDLALIKTSSGKVDTLDIGLDECFKTPLGWMASTKFMFRCDVSTGATSKKIRTEQRFYTYDVLNSELLEIASGMDIGYDALSPDGKYAVYYEKQNGFRIKNLVNGQTYSSPLPDGQVIWAHDSSKFAIITDNGDVYIANCDGSNQQKIYSTNVSSGLSSMDWFPDNKHLALIGYFDGNEEQTKMVVLSESGEIIQYDQIPTTDGYNIIGISPLPAIQR